jgi:N-formylglutamate deformylase
MFTSEILKSLLIHIPHSSNLIPSYDGYLVSPERVHREAEHMRDKGIIEAFEHVPAEVRKNFLVCPWSRVFCDVERFTDREPMEAVGMGYYYTHCDDGTPLRDNEQRTRSLVRNYYNAHHTSLYQMAWQRIVDTGQCIIIDAHSFPDAPFEYEHKMALESKWRGSIVKRSPDICIGRTDGSQTPSFLVEHLIKNFDDYGYSYNLDFPFYGSIIPQDLNREKRLFTIMLEINHKIIGEQKLKDAVANLFNFSNLPATTR